MRIAITTGAFAAAALAFAGPSSAETVEEFYRGKTMRFVIGHEVGGGYDIYARLVASHMSKHIPGQPSIIPQNMPGAGSRVFSNWMYSVAPRDGTVIGMAGQGIAVDEATKQSGVQYKAAEFGMIGNPSSDTLVLVTWAASGLDSIETVKKKGGMICGGSGGGAPTVVYPRVLTGLTGADIKVIAGYTGSGAYLLAMERGELNCAGAVSWTLVRVQLAQSVRDKKINILMQIGPKKEPEALEMTGKDIPLLNEFAQTDIDKKAVAVIMSSITVGRPIFTPPGAPAERLEALRNAFDKMLADPDYLAEAKNKKLTMNPVHGKMLQDVVREVTTASAEVLKRADELISTGAEEAAKGK